MQGNPLAVFPDATGLTEREMQALAREMNLSETSFVLPPTLAGLGEGADYRLRMFTTTMELPFAGHPAIGAAWVLADEGRFNLSGSSTEVRHELAIGVLPLTLHLSGRGATRAVREVTMLQGPTEVIHRVAGEEMEELAESLEVRERDLRWPADRESSSRQRMPAVISCGLPILVVPFARLDVLADVAPERGLHLARFAETYGSDTMALVAPGSTGAIADADVHVRVLTDPRSGPAEDPATGSAAGPIAVFLGLLAQRRGAAHRVVIEQGVEIGRPSRLVGEVDFSADGRPETARVSGSTVSVGEGWIELP